MTCYCHSRTFGVETNDMDVFNMSFHIRIAATDKAVQEWFKLNNTIEAKPSELMVYLIEKGSTHMITKTADL
jgi:hypothetical protein